jgi:hypothetical protein
MPFTDDDIAQIRQIIRDELTAAAVDIFEWKGSDQLKVSIHFEPGVARQSYKLEIDPETIDSIANALAVRFGARVR